MMYLVCKYSMIYMSRISKYNEMITLVLAAVLF